MREFPLAGWFRAHAKGVVTFLSRLLYCYQHRCHARLYACPAILRGSVHYSAYGSLPHFLGISTIHHRISTRLFHRGRLRNTSPPVFRRGALKNIAKQCFSAGVVGSRMAGHSFSNRTIRLASSSPVISSI